MTALNGLYAYYSNPDEWAAAQAHVHAQQGAVRMEVERAARQCVLEMAVDASRSPDGHRHIRNSQGSSSGPDCFTSQMKSDDFLLKNGRLFCNSRYGFLLSSRAKAGEPL